VIAAYATDVDRPDFPFWPMLFDSLVIRLLGRDDSLSRRSGAPSRSSRLQLWKVR
jgi:hypothetical protein